LRGNLNTILLSLGGHVDIKESLLVREADSFDAHSKHECRATLISFERSSKVWLGLGYNDNFLPVDGLLAVIKEDYCEEYENDDRYGGSSVCLVGALSLMLEELGSGEEVHLLKDLFAFLAVGATHSNLKITVK
jgi:hypothetical protein